MGDLPLTPAAFGTIVGITAIVTGTVQVIKWAIPTIPKVAVVLIALGTAELWSIAVAYFVLHSDIAVAILLAIVCWLGSMGIWSGGKTLVQGN